MIVILSKIVSIFLVMALGFFIVRAKVMPENATDYMVSLLLMVTSPAMIFSSVTSREFDHSVASATYQTILLGVLFFAVLFVSGYFLCKKIIKVAPKDLGVYILAFSTINNGFMGFPLTQAIFGNDILYFMIIHNICLILYIYLFSPLILNVGAGKSSLTFKELCRKACNPSTIASVLSIAMLFAGLHLPGTLFETADMVGGMNTPLSMLVVGMQLGESNFSRIFKNGKLLAMSVIKMTAVPALTFLAVNWLPVSVSVKVTIVFGAVLPAAVITSAMAAMEKKNSLLAAEAIAMTTLISLLAIPLVAMFLTNYYGL